MKSTKAVRELVQWINQNPGGNGKDVPRAKRECLREAESKGLIQYGWLTLEGWHVTPSGEKTLIAFS